MQGIKKVSRSLPKNLFQSFGISNPNKLNPNFQQKTNSQKKITRLMFQQTEPKQFLQKKSRENMINEQYGIPNQRSAKNIIKPRFFQINKKIKRSSTLEHDQLKIANIDVRDQVDFNLNIENIVEYSDIDQQFQNKILQGKYYIKQRRQQMSGESEFKQQYQTQQVKKKKVSKKTSIINHVFKPRQSRKIQFFSKPFGEVVSSNQPKLNQHPVKYEIQSFLQYGNLQISNIEDNQKFVDQSSVFLSSRMALTAKDQNQNQKDDETNRMKFFDQSSVFLSSRMALTAKDQNQNQKDEEINRMPAKMAQKSQQKEVKTHKFLKKSVTIKNNQQAINPESDNNKQSVKNKIQSKKTIRQSSNKFFDNIQDYLSNPHENKVLSKRKYVKLYQKIDQPIFLKELKIQQKKVQKISTALSLQKQDEKCNLLKHHTPQRPTSAQQFTSSTGEEFGSFQWRRFEKTVQKSDFQKELKHVEKLKQRGSQSLANYIQTLMILQDLNLIKETKQLLLNDEQKAS